MTSCWDVCCSRYIQTFSWVQEDKITLPQVLTQEDWNNVLYNGMAYTSPWASLYFIALMTFGNYVLFNLLVAILVEGFSTEVNSLAVHHTLFPPLIIHWQLKYYLSFNAWFQLSRIQIQQPQTAKPLASLAISYIEFITRMVITFGLHYKYGINRSAGLADFWNGMRDPGRLTTLYRR